MDRALGRTIHSIDKASLIRIAALLNNMEAECVRIWLRETTPAPKEDSGTRPRQRADFAATPLPIPATMDFEATPLLTPATMDFEATPLLTPATMDFEATPLLIPGIADFATTPPLRRLPLDYGWAIGKLRQAPPAPPTGAHSVAWTAAQPQERIAIMDFPASVPHGAHLRPAVAVEGSTAAEAVAVVVRDPAAAVVAVASADRRQLWQY
jgi:hypothetical protein